MPIFTYRGVGPRLGKNVFVAPTAVVSGDVEIGDDASIWFHAVARGDVNTIRVGPRTSIQDTVVLHVTHRRYPLEIGEGVVIGHGAILHGCTVESGALIGIGARVLDGARIGAGAQVAAGALVSPRQTVPPGQLAMGVPAKVVRPLRAEEQDAIRQITKRYLEVKQNYIDEIGLGH
ncbi:MAG: gamma carbonic anhydrase family protein [Acidobacteriota bacterium]